MLFPLERRGLNVPPAPWGSIDEHTYKSECLMWNPSLEGNAEETCWRLPIIALPRSSVCVSGLGSPPCCGKEHPQRMSSAGWSSEIPFLFFFLMDWFFLSEISRSIARNFWFAAPWAKPFFFMSSYQTEFSKFWMNESIYFREGMSITRHLGKNQNKTER